MKKQLWALVIAVGMIVLPVYGGEAELKQIKATAGEIDKLIVQKPRLGYTKDRFGNKKTKVFQPDKPEKFYPTLSKLLKMEERDVSAALKKTNFQLSDVIFARILSSSTDLPFEKVLRERSTDAWLRKLEENNLPLEKVHRIMEKIYVEMAFLSLGS